MKSRIVFVHHSPEFGGAERHLLDLVRSLGPQQDCVIWYDPTDFYSDAFEDWPNVRIMRRPYRIHNRTIVRFWFELVRLRPRVVVLVKGIADIFPWTAYLAARISGAKRIIVIDQLIADGAPPPIPVTGMRTCVQRLFGWRARYMWGKRLQGYLPTVTVAVSEAVRQRLVTEYNYPAAKTMTIYNAVNLTCFEKAKENGSSSVHAEDQNAARVLRIICIARLSPVKRIDLLLDSLALVDQVRKNWVCTIVGGGSLEDELVKKARSLGLAPRVTFTGHVKNVRSYLENADLAVLSSDKEGLPLSLVEAMAAGLPCLVTDVGGNCEIVKHGETGLVVEAGSSKQLADGIAYFMDHADERRKMGQAGRCLANERFSLSRMTDAYKPLLRMD
jgi:glycosyltransferase involved in cell wall biosynthesis